MARTANILRRQVGLSYVEVLVASAIIAVSLLPAMEALNASMNSSQLSAALQKQNFLLLDKYEEVLAQSFDVLDAEAESLVSETTPSAAFSDPAGVPNRRLVYLQRYDADNADNDNDPFTGGDPGLCWVRIVVSDSNLSRSVLVSKY